MSWYNEIGERGGEEEAVIFEKQSGQRKIKKRNSFNINTVVVVVCE